MSSILYLETQGVSNRAHDRDCRPLPPSRPASAVCVCSPSLPFAPRRSGVQCPYRWLPSRQKSVVEAWCFRLGDTHLTPPRAHRRQPPLCLQARVLRPRAATAAPFVCRSLFVSPLDTSVCLCCCVGGVCLRLRLLSTGATRAEKAREEIERALASAETPHRLRPVLCITRKAMHRSRRAQRANYTSYLNLSLSRALLTQHTLSPAFLLSPPSTSTSSPRPTAARLRTNPSSFT